MQACTGIGEESTMSDTRRIQDHALDESTDVTPQHFDEEGYVIGHPHHTAVADTDLGPDGRLVETTDAPAAPEGDPVAETDEPDAPDGQFDGQRMPTTDGALSEPDRTIVLDDAEASIAPPAAAPDGPVPGAPDGAPTGPDITPDEPAPLAPDEGVEPGRTVGGQAF